MKTPDKLIVIVFTLLLSTVGYAASNEEGDSSEFTAKMEKSENRHEMSGSMHGGSMMHYGMANHHMMQPGVSPVTIMVQPGMMPMMNHNMNHQGRQNGHGGYGQGQDKKQRHHNSNNRNMMRKEHMEQVEQRLENIEALLAELVELQRNGQ